MDYLYRLHFQKIAFHSFFSNQNQSPQQMERHTPSFDYKDLLVLKRAVKEEYDSKTFQLDGATAFFYRKVSWLITFIALTGSAACVTFREYETPLFMVCIVLIMTGLFLNHYIIQMKQGFYNSWPHKDQPIDPIFIVLLINSDRITAINAYMDESQGIEDGVDFERGPKLSNRGKAEALFWAQQINSD